MDHIQVKKFSFRRKNSSRKKLEEQKESNYDNLSYVSEETMNHIYNDLINEFSLTEEQIYELSGYCTAVTITKIYADSFLNKERHSLLIACGPTRNGATGLICARHLKLFGYRPTIYYSGVFKHSLYKTLISQCEKCDIPFLSYLPSDPALITNSYGLIIDALYSPELEPNEDGCTNHVIDILTKCEIPVISLDVPCGWRNNNFPSSADLQPDVLISLLLPKKSSKPYKGRKHYIVGRFIPDEVLKKYDLKTPSMKGYEPFFEVKQNQDRNNSDIEFENSSSENGDK